MLIKRNKLTISIQSQLRFTEIQAQLTNFPNLPNLCIMTNLVKIKKSFKCIKIKMYFGVKSKVLARLGKLGNLGREFWKT